MTTDIEVLDAIKKLLKDNLKDIKLEKNNNDDKLKFNVLRGLLHHNYTIL